MRTAQVAALAVLVMFTAIRASADDVPTGDARIIIVGGDPPPGACNVTLPSFMINPHGNGGGFFACVNDTGENWIGLEITGKTMVSGDKIKFGSGAAFACNGGASDANPGDVFSTCTILSQIGHSITFELTGGTIPDVGSNSFSIDLSNDGDLAGLGKGGWEGQLTITPITTPEPGEMTLFLFGLGGMWVCGRRKTAKSIN